MVFFLFHFSLLSLSLSRSLLLLTLLLLADGVPSFNGSNNFRKRVLRLCLLCSFKGELSLFLSLSISLPDCCWMRIAAGINSLLHPLE